MTGQWAYAAIAGAAEGVVIILAVAALWWLRRRPALLSALAAGTGVSLAVVMPWSFMAMLTVGPSGPLRLTRHDLLGSYARMAAGPTGNAADFAAAVIGITVACFLFACRRQVRLRARRSAQAAVAHAAPAQRGPAAPSGITSARRRYR